jgi:hypothetical protein
MRAKIEHKCRNRYRKVDPRYFVSLISRSSVTPSNMIDNQVRRILVSADVIETEDCCA